MDKLLNVRLQIERTKAYLTPLLPMANSHMVGFFSQNLWSKFVPPSIIEEVEKHGVDSAIEAFWQTKFNLMQTCSKNIFKPYATTVEKTDADTFGKFKLSFPNLISFIESANLHSLSQNDFCVTTDQFKNKLGIDVDVGKRVVIQSFMSRKKSHEVENITHFLDQLHKWSESTHIIDVGGGKGYLSLILSKYYKIPVLNIDRSIINKKGALKLNSNLEKNWKEIVNLIENAQDVNVKKIKRSRRRKREKKPEDDVNNSAVCENNVDCLYRHVTENISPHTDIVKILENNYPCENETKRICFTGLHTCGSLGSSILRLFLECSSASLLCIVPCCYNLLTEEVQSYEISSYPENFENVQYDFPMSHHLKGYVVGQNARVLAAQALDRVVSSRQLPRQSIYYRALLEVLLGKYEGKRDDRSKLKDLNDEEGFVEYVNIALEKLKLGDRFKFTEAELNDFEASQSDQLKNLHLYYLLRMCISPVLESLLLLDRLMFLLENGFDGRTGEAYLVRLFDSVLSPRCMAIVAYRYKTDKG